MLKKVSWFLLFVIIFQLVSHALAWGLDRDLHQIKIDMLLGAVIILALGTYSKEKD